MPNEVCNTSNGQTSDMVRHVELNANARRQQRRRRRRPLLRRSPIFGGRLLIYFILCWSAGSAISSPFNGNQSREKRDPFSITLIWLCVFRSWFFVHVLCVCLSVRKSKMIRLFSTFDRLRWSSFIWLIPMQHVPCLQSDPVLMWLQLDICREWEGERERVRSEGIRTDLLAEHKLRNWT